MPKLINKSYKDYNKLSRYQNFPYYYNTITKKYQYGTITWLNKDTPFQYYIVQKNDTLDLISLRAYGTPIYYWIIASFNRIVDPFKSLKPGTKLKIPTKSTIEFEDY